MHDNRAILENRIGRETTERIRPAEVRFRSRLQARALHLPGEPVPISRLPGPEAFVPIEPGTPWGPPWGTTWFEVTGEVPAELPDGLPRVRVELGYGPMPGFSAEGAVHVGGRIVRGLHPSRRTVPLGLVAADGRVDFLVEAAANPDFSLSFRPSPLGSRDTAGEAPLYVFGGAELEVVDEEVRDLLADIEALNGLMRVLPLGHPRRRRLQYLFQRAFDCLDLEDVPGTAAGARAELAPGLDLPAAASAHRIAAIGHAHLDTAWLWPLRETRRKAARTFANAVDLMDRRPDYRFACSQAVQYAWVEQDHPELFDRVRDKVASGQWVPVGGMWVEADMNLPSGESLCRQLIHGQRWFESRFGRRCTEVWIPDVFGYPGSLPQMFASAGCRRFVTQKLSWNKQNRLPHNTFWWEGIDGTRVLAHFPPVDTYNAEIVPQELAHAVESFSDHYWSDRSLMPFGYGDGGGGPTEEMMRRLDRLGDLDGMPRVGVQSPEEFFELVESEAATAPVPVWRGELYFETHRGTLTTQAETKVGNRRCEQALRSAELWLATVGDDSHHEALDELWKSLLVHQFHDILPGSSIGWVHEETVAAHDRILKAADSLAASALGSLSTGPIVANAATRDRDEVVAFDSALLTAAPAPVGGDQAADLQRLADGQVAARVVVPGLGVAELEPLTASDRVEAAPGLLANSMVEVGIDERGNLVSVVDRAAGRELIPPGSEGVHLTLAPDHPVEFDAWDLEQWTDSLSVALPPADSVELIESGPLLGSIRATHRFGSSSEAVITYVLRAGSRRVDLEIALDWREDEKLLALEVPLSVAPAAATCEIQFGVESRPTHTNTSWDSAKFEVCAHRFVDLSEDGWGVAVLNDGRYGHSVHPDPTHDTRAGAGRVRVSLLRAPNYPDPRADRGRHQVTVALLPHGPGLTEVLAQAEALNSPLRVVGAGPVGSSDAGLPAPVVTVGDPRVQVSAVKAADDGSGDLVVRLWEATGTHVRTELGFGPGTAAVRRCDLLEEPQPGSPALVVEGGHLPLELRPFELVTLRCARPPGRGSARRPDVS